MFDVLTAPVILATFKKKWIDLQQSHAFRKGSSPISQKAPRPQPGEPDKEEHPEGCERQVQEGCDLPLLRGNQRYVTFSVCSILKKKSVSI